VRTRIDRDPVELPTPDCALNRTEAGVTLQAVRTVGEQEMITRGLSTFGESLFDQFARYSDLVLAEDAGQPHQFFNRFHIGGLRPIAEHLNRAAQRE
jgi:hypothetical protein